MTATHADLRDTAARLARGQYLRTLHYHNTPAACRALYDAQLAWVTQHYHTVTCEELGGLFSGGRPDFAKPPLWLGVFDGYRSNAEVLYPLLEAHGLHGWFLLVSDFINTAGQDQYPLLPAYSMEWTEGEYTDGRWAMTWAQAAAIATAGHTIVNHSATHFRLGAGATEEQLQYEVAHAEALIKRNTGVRPDAFSWLGGAWYSLYPRANEVLRDRGYQYLIGYRFECIRGAGAGQEHLAFDSALLSDAWAAGQLALYKQKTGGRGINGAVPALLPLYHLGAEMPCRQRPEDVTLAAQFYTLALYGAGQGLSLWQARCQALDCLAVNGIGEGFPFCLPSGEV